MAEMKEPVIVDAVRTPVGKRGKALKDWHPADLLGRTSVVRLFERAPWLVLVVGTVQLNLDFFLETVEPR